MYLKVYNFENRTTAGHYLYTNKRLDLPAIGTFLLDNSVIIEQENNRQSKNILLEGISFESNPSIKKPDDELIQYISSHSGRIKPLATADLDSFLGLAIQFINIGKPFLIDGIGSLAKNNSGGFTFSPGQVLTEKLNDYVAMDAPAIASREADNDYKRIFYPDKPTMQWKKPVAILLILLGIVLAIWGGYTIYKRTSEENDSVNNVATNNKINDPVPLKDSVSLQKDSVIETVQKIANGNSKFVLEIADQKRALQRFDKLKKYQWDVQIETKDSLSYKIFMLLPVAAADTTRVLDSLSQLIGKRVYIEKQ